MRGQVRERRSDGHSSAMLGRAAVADRVSSLVPTSCEPHVFSLESCGRLPAFFQIVAGNVAYPLSMPTVAVDVVSKFLTVDPTKRLGYVKQALLCYVT